MCDHGTCCHGIHNSYNTPASRHSPERSRKTKDSGAPKQHGHHHHHHQQQHRGHHNAHHDSTYANSRPGCDSISVNVKIHGKVHGVYFRKWTVDTASKLGLNGWVRNNKDGMVEAVFSGKPNTVDHMLEKCKVGPSRACVSGVDATACEEPKMRGFKQVNDGPWSDNPKHTSRADVLNSLNNFLKNDSQSCPIFIPQIVIDIGSVVDADVLDLEIFKVFSRHCFLGYFILKSLKG